MTPFDSADWHLVPNRFRGELNIYLRTGKPPESITLISILSNNLHDAIVLARPTELATMVAFLSTHFPSIAWGSGERIARWEANGGFEGQARLSARSFSDAPVVHH